MLKKAEKTLFEISDALLKNEDILRLLKYPEKDALKRVVPDRSSMENYIFHKPVLESGIEQYKRNVFIMVNLRSITFTGRENINNFEIIVICDSDQWELEDNKIRPLQIVNNIVDTLDNTKFSSVGKLSVTRLEEFVVQKQLYGYIVDFENADISEGVEF